MHLISKIASGPGYTDARFHIMLKLLNNCVCMLINCYATLQTILYVATVMNWPEVVAYLVSQDADPNIYARVAANGLPTRMQGPLHCVALKGDIGLATLTNLLQSPHVEINKADSDGKRVLLPVFGVVSLCSVTYHMLQHCAVMMSPSSVSLLHITCSVSLLHITCSVSLLHITCYSTVQ